MRRLSLLVILLAGLLLAPVAAHAATPGVNIADIPSAADLDEAHDLGAKYVRVFAPNDQASHYGLWKAVVSGAGARGMKVVFVLTGNADGTDTPPDPTAFANSAAAFAAQMQQAGGAAAYEIWNEEDETQFWGAVVDAGRYAAILKAA